MKVDLRDKIKKESKMKKLPDNHRIKFEQLVQKELHKKPKRNYYFLKIAAAVLLFVSLGFTGYQLFNANLPQNVTSVKDKPPKSINAMATVSPDLKKAEDFYLTRINYQLAKIAITDENRDLLEVYLAQLDVLQKEYAELHEELASEKEISIANIDALIENLQLRLQLMRQLKKKLENIKNEKNESKQA